MSLRNGDAVTPFPSETILEDDFKVYGNYVVEIGTKVLLELQ